MTSKSRILLFTRYPVPGKTKTRLIPTLGKVGAANMHKQLTEKVFRQTRLIEDMYGIPTTVYFSGGNVQQMHTWLNCSECRKQCTGDIGTRMAEAFRDTFADHDQYALLIGSDIPELSADIILQGFELLQSHEVVIGPSRDGGYYLIGCQRSERTPLFDILFTDIPWSTDKVFELTLSRLVDHNISTGILPLLSDIDTPEDLRAAGIGESS